MKAAHIMHSSCRLLQRALNPLQGGLAAAACTSAAQASRSGAFAKRCSSLDTTPVPLAFKHYSSLTGTSPARILEVTAAALNSYPPAWPPSHAFLGHRLIPYATVATSGTSRTGPAGGDDAGRGDPADPFALAFWEQQVAQLPYRQAQTLVSARGLPAAGRKEELRLRLAEALLDEHVAGSTPTDLDTPGVRELLASGGRGGAGGAAGPGLSTSSGSAKALSVAAYLKRWEAIKDPSTAEEQSGPEPLLFNCRPAVHAGLHPALASPVFGRLIDRLAANARPSQEDLTVALDLSELASQYHTDQADYETLLQALLSTYLGKYVYKLGPEPTSTMLTDGMVVLNPQDSKRQWRSCAFLEVKVDLGVAGDSSFQGTAYYGLFWKSRCTSIYFQRTCCPALLLEAVGPHLRVSALYWLDKVTVRPLTPLINLLRLDDDPDSMFRLASTLASVKATMQELYSFYSPQQQEQLLQPAAAQPPGRAAGLLAAMPYPLADYQQAMRIGDSKLVYRAMPSSDGKPAVVRFCRGYGEAAHRAWAAAGLAPQLHRVVWLPGGWLQVEMEWLGAPDGWQELTSIKEPAAAAAASAAALAALQQAHGVQGGGGQRFAHGDMRVRNVMVRQPAGTSGGGCGSGGGSSGTGGGGGSGAGGAGAYDIRFIGFGWSGVDGEATYPPYLNTAIGWPPGVAFSEPVRQQHDTELLAMSVEQLLQNLRGPL